MTWSWLRMYLWPLRVQLGYCRHMVAAPPPQSTHQSASSHAVLVMIQLSTLRMGPGCRWLRWPSMAQDCLFSCFRLWLNALSQR
jgi:hypothetical protein